VTYHADFSKALTALTKHMQNDSVIVKPTKWQSIDVSQRPEAEMREMIHIEFQTYMPTVDLDYYRSAIAPNLPWADHHFIQERISGQPINPGWTWKTWPWGHSADKFRREGEQFSHSYAERYWPKYAGLLNADGEQFGADGQPPDTAPHYGVRYKYGDLDDVVDLLVREPDTRQAYLPIWFPEDTGVVHGERVPCTLGYHFMRRGNGIHIYYPIRSCDFYRHLRDDLYLTVRLLLWVLGRCQELNPTDWSKVKPGLFSFWAGSLHMFVGEYRKLYGTANQS